ncbi:MAG: hypothetical protein RMM17_03085 [Acidobacteriota bacterium]|nr:hypothetical protein [Blastocatellia bacterium]MDW8411653.1 hypothetical protein [Acidobacteriota bacterium]
MLTGYNTDISYSGVTYHVQTEDKGANNPVIESLVYVRGAILAAKRTYYQKELENGITEEQLQAMLEKQHRTILAIIKAGRIQELVERLNKQRQAQQQQATETSAPSAQMPVPPEVPAVTSTTIPSAQPSVPAAQLGTLPAEPIDSAKTAASEAVPALFAEFDLDKIIFEYLQAERMEEKLEIKLRGSTEFYAGDSVVLQAEVKRNDQPLAGVPVIIKVIGTTFKPQVYTSRTGNDGVSVIPVILPRFNAGSAAIVVQTSSEFGEAEVKHLIRRR